MSKKNSNILKFVVFDLVTEPRTLTLALNVQKVMEVVEFGPLTTLPYDGPQTEGLYDLRGTPVPVFNIMSVLSGKPVSYGAGARIVICDLQNVLIGFPVARTSRTISCPTSAFLPPPRGGLAAGKKVISGVIKQEGIYIPVLDLDSILDTIDPTMMADPDQSPAEAPDSYAGKRVLIVEDSKSILKRLVRVFSELGFAVDAAENGEAGLSLVEKSGPYDLIFTDIEMPLLDGISMAKKIKESPALASVPILFNSALSNPALISDIERERLGRYIVKYDKNLILAEVKAVMRKAA